MNSTSSTPTPCWARACRTGSPTAPLSPAELLHRVGARVEARGAELWADA
ncbi:hypothetical protein [Streptomyces sp. NPDC101455]